MYLFVLFQCGSIIFFQYSAVGLKIWHFSNPLINSSPDLFIACIAMHLLPANGEAVLPPSTDFSKVLVSFSYFHHRPFVVGLNMTNFINCDFFFKFKIIGRLNSLENFKKYIKFSFFSLKGIIYIFASSKDWKLVLKNKLQYLLLSS